MKELFRQIAYTYNALALQYDMVLHCPKDLEDLGHLIHYYEAEFKRQADAWEEYLKRRKK